MALDWDSIIVEDDENSQVQDTPVTIMASGTPGSPISWDKLIIEEEETTVQGEDESVLIFASGVPGHSATIDGVTAETLPEGSEATVENVGTSDNARFHFGIPRGNTGDKGDPGDQGERGERGYAGIGSAEYDAENERVIFNGVDENEVYTIDETDALLNDKLDARDTELTGSIVTFEAENDHAIKDLKVEINPIQDLHGLPNPYPAGGGKNLFNPDTVTTGYIDDANGILKPSATCNSTDYIPVLPNTVYGITSAKTSGNWGAWYDSNKDYISGIAIGAKTSATETSPNNAAYLRFTVNYTGNNTDFANNVQIEKGAVTSWTPYSNICPITGWDEANVARTGKNLLPITTEMLESGTIDGVHGTDSSATNRVRTKNLFPFPYDDIVEKGYVLTIPSGYNIALRFYDAEGNYIYKGDGVTGWIINLCENTYLHTGIKYARFVFRKSDNSDINVSDIVDVAYQLELGSTGSAYEAPSVKSVTVDLGDTRYVGIMDVNTGVLTLPYAFANLDGSESWSKNAANRYWTCNAVSYTIWASNTFRPQNLNVYPYIKSNIGFVNYQDFDNDFGYGTALAYGIRVNVPECDSRDVNTTVADFKAWLSQNPVQVTIPLKDPVIIQLTPTEVSTLIGENHLWADSGDSTVTLRLPTGDLAYQDTVDYETQVTNKPDFGSMLSGTEATMKATKNYSAGALIAVGDDLYKALSAIASGTTLTVGSNVTATTIEAELALKANSTDVTTALALKANSADVYTKAEVDALVESEITAYHDDTKATVITETASGSIVSITDGSPAPVIALNVAIEPVQDLHGYDNPWPAGGEKNKLPVKFYNGLGYNNSAGTQITLTELNDVTASGGKYTRTVSGWGGMAMVSEPLAAGKYYLLANMTSTNLRSTAYVLNSDMTISRNLGNHGGGGSDTSYSYNTIITLTGDETYIGFCINSSAVGSVSISTPMVALSDSATDFAPYSNICPITGWDEAVVTRTGKNLLKIDESTIFQKSVNVEYLANGIRVYNEVAGTYRTNIWKAITLDKFKGQIVTFSCNAQGDYKRVIGRYKLANGTNYGNAIFEKTNAVISYSINIPNDLPDGVFLTFAFYCTGASSAIGEATYTDIQLELGSTATSYEPYQGTFVTIDLDGTRYGGTLNVLTGEMTVDRGLVVFDGANDGNRVSYKYPNKYVYNLSAPSVGNTLIPTPNGNTVIGCLSDYFQNITDNQAYDGSRNGISTSTSGGFAKLSAPSIKAESQADMNAWLAENPVTVVYPLATPLTVQLTPEQLSTLLGQNNIWADTGDVAVEYRADTKLYIQKLTKPTEDDMIANTNIAANTFFMVGNSLYFATSAIATGTTIVPGQNCTALSLADALNNLNA